RYVPPKITRALQSSYRYHSGEQLHFLVEYICSSVECQSAWQVQHSNDKMPKPIEDGLIVNADCSSILIIESITSELQGLYTFYVENLYGRAKTQTLVIIDSNNNDNDDTQHETSNENNELQQYYSNGSSNKTISAIHDLSSNEPSEYEELKA
ncbi:unnamed protein product, partial [Adineta steineri]